MTAKTLKVDLGSRSYPIFIGEGLISEAGLISNHTDSSQLMVVSNETVAPLYLKKLHAALGEHQVEQVILPDGEQYKNLDHLNTIYTALLEHRFDRGCTLVALGGGVVGDMCGFAAASYQRGVKFIQIPTTLLAQVDSSVGGKTGVNHALGKNMIGAFHQPQCVIADTATLNTLDDRQLSAGLAEVIKYGLIDDLAFFEWLESNMDRLLGRDPEALTYAIYRSCEDKARVVAADEKEAGMRALLNLGHTFGHAIENGMGYGEWLHGEAVGAGMCMAADLSARLGWISASEADRATRLIEAARLPVAAPLEMTTERFLDAMSVDKKVKDGQLRFILMESFCCSKVVDSVDQSLLLQTLASAA